jgi:hypothetical protein
MQKQTKKEKLNKFFIVENRCASWPFLQDPSARLRSQQMHSISSEIDLFLIGFNSTILIILPLLVLLYWNMAAFLFDITDMLYEKNTVFRGYIEWIDNMTDKCKAYFTKKPLLPTTAPYYQLTHITLKEKTTVPETVIEV